MAIMQLTQAIQLLPSVSERLARNTVQPMLPGLELQPAEKLVVTNRQIAEVLANIADILERQHSNPYRIQAYRNAARGVLDLLDLGHGDVDLDVRHGYGEQFHRKYHLCVSVVAYSRHSPFLQSPFLYILFPLFEEYRKQKSTALFWGVQRWGF